MVLFCLIFLWVTLSEVEILWNCLYLIEEHSLVVNARPSYKCQKLISFFLISNFWIIFLSTISPWINKWLVGMNLIEENKVAFITFKNYEVKFKSVHIIMSSSLLRRVEFLTSHRLKEHLLWQHQGQCTVKIRLLKSALSLSPLTQIPLIFQIGHPFLSDANRWKRQDHMGWWDAKCIYTCSAATSTVGRLHAQEVPNHSVSTLFSTDHQVYADNI